MSYPTYQVPAGDVLPVFFSSYAGATGASVTLTGLAITDIEIYRDGSVTQRASDAGYTLLDTDGIDFDAITGIHGFSIDTGDNTDAGFYTVGAWFTVVVSAVTVDAQTVNFIACQFRLMPAESVAGKPKVDADTFGGAAGTFSAGRPEVNATHAAGTAWGSGAITASAIAAAALNGKGDWNIGKTGYSLTQAFPANFSVMSISATTGLVDITQTAADKVWSTAARVLTAGTNIVLAKGTGVTGFNDLDAAGVAGAVWDAATVTYGTAGSYGLLVETNLDAAVTSRMATYTQPTGFLAATFPGTVASTTNITAATGIVLSGVTHTGAVIPTVTAVTNGVTVATGGIGSGAIAAAEQNALADAFLDRNMATGTDSGTDSTTTRTVRQALRALRNKVNIAGGVATVTKENDSTASWTAAVATTAGNPISSIDPT